MQRLPHIRRNDRAKRKGQRKGVDGSNKSKGCVFPKRKRRGGAVFWFYPASRPDSFFGRSKPRKRKEKSRGEGENNRKRKRSDREAPAKRGILFHKAFGACGKRKVWAFRESHLSDCNSKRKEPQREKTTKKKDGFLPFPISLPTAYKCPEDAKSRI